MQDKPLVTICKYKYKTDKGRLHKKRYNRVTLISCFHSSCVICLRVSVCGRMHGGGSKSVNARYGSSEPLLLIDSSAARPFGLCCRTCFARWVLYKTSDHSHCVFIAFFGGFSADVNVFAVPL